MLAAPWFDYPVFQISESKMNAVARAQSIFQMLTLLEKYLYRQRQYSKPWDGKCLALIAQMVRAFGMNPKVGGSSPSQVETFSVLKNFDTFTRTSVRVSKMNVVVRAQLTFQMLTLLQKHPFVLCGPFWAMVPHPHPTPFHIPDVH